MRERESIFSDFVSDLRRKEKEEKSQQKEKVCIEVTAGWFLYLTVSQNMFCVALKIFVPKDNVECY